MRGDEEGVGLAEEFVEVVGVGVKGHISSGTPGGVRRDGGPQ